MLVGRAVIDSYPLTSKFVLHFCEVGLPGRQRSVAREAHFGAANIRHPIV
jgi:hypothetical protein